MCRKQLPTRQPSAVNGVSGQTTCKVMATVKVTQFASTIISRVRAESRDRTAFANATTVIRAL